MRRSPRQQLRATQTRRMKAPVLTIMQWVLFALGGVTVMTLWRKLRRIQRKEIRATPS